MGQDPLTRDPCDPLTHDCLLWHLIIILSHVQNCEKSCNHSQTEQARLCGSHVAGPSVTVVDMNLTTCASTIHSQEVTCLDTISILGSSLQSSSVGLSMRQQKPSPAGLKFPVDLCSFLSTSFQPILQSRFLYSHAQAD